MKRGTSILLYTWLPKRVSSLLHKKSSQTLHAPVAFEVINTFAPGLQTKQTDNAFL